MNEGVGLESNGKGDTDELKRGLVKSGSLEMNKHIMTDKRG